MKFQLNSDALYGQIAFKHSFTLFIHVSASQGMVW